MATTVIVGPDTLRIQREIDQVRSAGNIPDNLGLSYSGPALTNGTAALQADREYCLFGQSIPAAGSLLLNLSALTDSFGNAIAFARLKRWYFDVTGASAVTVGAGGLASPTAAPALTTATTGGTIPAGVWLGAYSYITASGETLVSPNGTVTTTGGTSTITFGAVALPAGATGLNFYLSLAAGGFALARAGTNGTGAAFTAAAPPGATAAAAPRTNTTLNGLASVFGGDPAGKVTINKGCCWYGGIDPGATGYLVQAGANQLLFTNQDAVNAAVMNIELAGCSA